MKYSIRGNLNSNDQEGIITALNNYTLWRLTTSTDPETENLTFEVWVNDEEDKDALFDDLKPIVDTHGEFIDWHECTHDEENPRPCVIEEEYRGE